MSRDGYTFNPPPPPPSNSILDQSFSYDGAGRLTRAQVGTKLWTYAYDATGNRTAHSSPGLGAGSDTIAATSNWLTSSTAPGWSFAYGSTGDAKTGTAATTAASWSVGYALSDHNATLQKGGVSTAYEYDGEQRRVLKSSGSPRASYVYGMQGELLGEYDQTTGQTIREYVWLGSTPAMPAFRISILIGLFVLSYSISEARFSLGADTLTASSTWPSLAYLSPKEHTHANLIREEFGYFPRVETGLSRGDGGGQSHNRRESRLCHARPQAAPPSFRNQDHRALRPLPRR